MRFTKERRKNRLFGIYSYLEQIPIFSGFLYKARRIQEWYTPGEEEQIRNRTIKYLRTECIYEILFLLLACFVWNATLERIIMIGIGIYLVHAIYQFIYIRKRYYQLLVELEQYLVVVRNEYQNCGMVEEALQESLWDSNHAIGSHIRQLYEALEWEEQEELQQYKENVSISYLLTFFILCKSCMTYGDTYVSGGSSFLKNIGHMKDEIHNELLYRKRLAHRFSGVLFVTVFPVFFLDFIRNWSVWNLPELIRYYDGSYGILMKCLICFVTVMVLEINRYLLEPKILVKGFHPCLEAISKRKSIQHFLLHVIHKRENVWEAIHRKLQIVSSSYNVVTFLLLKMLCGLSAWLAMVWLSVTLIVRENLLEYTIQPITLLQDEITLRGSDIQCIPLVLGCIIVPILVYWIPNLLLTIKAGCKNRDLEEETMSLQAILIMLTPIPKMTIEIMLEWLCYGSNLFQQALLDCSEQYVQDQEKALEELYETMTYIPFRQLIKNLEVSDRIGIYQAFEELPADYAYTIEKRKQDNEINTDDRGAVGQFVSFFPLGMVIGGYLIIPFVLESITQFLSYVSQMQSIT
ncbi:hypothetical protein [Anaerosporobacter faecicola]|uniref:hypothetical protein n=1 Tax=Anaerosporobacter faecicola TaxID=2718714 RepID=UPI00143ACB18|nr:hypothetical protein [Anaerosporobacter faecicola]